MSEPQPRITQSTLYDEPVVCVHVSGIVLVMSEVQYGQCVVRGKLWRRERTNEARLQAAAERAEIQQTAMDWLETEIT